VAKTIVIYFKVFLDFVCQRLSTLVNVSWSYSRNKSGTVFLRHVYVKLERAWLLPGQRAVPCVTIKHLGWYA